MTSTLAPLAAGRKAIFLDIDGTYADHGHVPRAHTEAVRAARARGHLVLLCTGRPLSLIFDDFLEAGFDGIVAAAGGHVTLGSETLLDIRFPGPVAARAVAIMEAHGARFWAEAPEATYARQKTIDALAAFWASRATRHAPTAEEDGRARRDVASHLVAVESFEGLTFGKLTSMSADTPLDSIAAEIGPEVASIPSSIPGLDAGAGELFLAHVHKAAGIETAITRLGLSREHVVAFGDGANDLEMLAFAGTGIAIEGASPELLAVADGTCAGPSEAGLADAFAALGLIEP